MKLRILIVDDHPLWRTGLRQTLEKHPDYEIVGEASTGAAAVALAAELKPDLTLMDLHLPDTLGVEATRQILECWPEARIVAFSGDPARSLVDAALQAGVCGYILKQSAIEEVILAIDLVMAGRLYLSPELSAGVLEDYRKSLIGGKPAARPTLTDRDKQLLRLISSGRRNKEIAKEMGVSAKSIETYRARLMKKAECASTAELVRYAIREGIAEL